MIDLEDDYCNYTYCTKCKSVWYRMIVGDYCPDCKNSENTKIYEGEEEERFAKEKKNVLLIFWGLVIISFFISIFGIYTIVS